MTIETGRPNSFKEEEESLVVNEAIPSVARSIADLASSRTGLLTRPWTADEHTVAQRIADAIPGEARLITDSVGRTQGWALLYAEREVAPGELRAELVVDSGAEPQLVADAVEDLIRRATQHTPGTRSDSLLLIIDEHNRQLESTLRNAGFEPERRFAVEHRKIEENASHLQEEISSSANRGGLDVLDWNQVVRRGRSNEVRQLQHLTFREHWGNLSKTESEWQHYLNSSEFAPEFSGAAVDRFSGEVVGYVLGSRSRSATSAGEEVTAHTEYIGVSPSHRRRGVAATLLKYVWAAALDAGLFTASLGVDVKNESNARHLYESLGYHTVGYHVAYRLSNFGLHLEARTSN